MGCRGRESFICFWVSFLTMKITLDLLWLPKMSVEDKSWLVYKASWCVAFLSIWIFCNSSFHLMMQESFWLVSASCRLGLCESIFWGSLDYWWKVLCSVLHNEEDSVLACFLIGHLWPKCYPNMHFSFHCEEMCSTNWKCLEAVKHTIDWISNKIIGHIWLG